MLVHGAELKRSVTVEEEETSIQLETQKNLDASSWGGWGLRKGKEQEKEKEANQKEEDGGKNRWRVENTKKEKEKKKKKNINEIKDKPKTKNRWGEGGADGSSRTMGEGLSLAKNHNSIHCHEPHSSLQRGSRNKHSFSHLQLLQSAASSFTQHNIQHFFSEIKTQETNVVL